MKHVLLGTTALVATGLMAGSAFAADNAVKLGLGGFYRFAAGGLIGNDSEDELVDPSREHVVKQNIEVHFKGEAVLDNGLTVGARVELEGQDDSGGNVEIDPGEGFVGDAGGDQIDQAFMYFRGGFGEFRFGDTAEAFGQLCYLVPSASGIFGADSPSFNFTNAGVNGYGATNGTCYGIDDNSTKIEYFSPNFAGFTFALSYSPDNTEDTRNSVGGFGGRDDSNPGQNSEVVSAAAQFATDIDMLGGFNLTVGGGFSHAFDEEVALATPSHDDEREDWQAYAAVGFGGFTVGGVYTRRTDIAATDDISDSNTVYGAGLTFDAMPVMVGFGWTRGHYEPATGGASSDDQHDDFVATASYALGPGVNVDGMVEYSDYDSDVEDADYDTVGLGIGFVINF
jgi:predicted porin